MPERKIVLSLLTWNLRDVSLESLAALAREGERLQRAGAEPQIVVCDNGSTDGTREALRAAAARLALPCRLLLNGENLGNSRARNQVLDVVLEAGADYLMFTDGDIEVVPGSVVAMLRHLERSAPEVGGIGAECFADTRHREQATPYVASLAEYRISDDRDELWAARTGYGLFRRAVFAAGVRFDESPPFDRPGWGCEDVDLAFQIHDQGFYLQTVSGMTFLHRGVNSSIPLLRELGADPRADYELRRRYVIEKWQDTGLGAKTVEYLRGTGAAPAF